MSKRKAYITGVPIALSWRNCVEHTSALSAASVSAIPIYLTLLPNLVALDAAVLHAGVADGRSSRLGVVDGGIDDLADEQGVGAEI